MRGLGAAGACVALGAISTTHHGWPIYGANYASSGPLHRVREVYAGTVRQREK
jgi:hypothetical protein